jgi:uncharacterized membrane protein
LPLIGDYILDWGARVMAGIGFELKRLFRSKGVFGGLRATLFASFITFGPTILCIFMITVLQKFLENRGFSLEERLLFMGAIIYSFIFSLILTSGLTITLSRYISDEIYKQEYDDILPSLTGALILCLILGGTTGIIFYYRKPISLLFKISAYLLFIELNILWVQMVYVSALKDYMKLIKGFFAGIVASIVLAQILVLRVKQVTAILLSVDIGFLLIIAFFAITIKGCFNADSKAYFKFFEYFDKYPSLFFCGFLQTLGLYVHNFIIWSGKDRIRIEETFIMSPLFDVPVFWAFLSILPALVTFVVFCETSFFERYKTFYDTICSGGTWGEIKRSKEEMLKVLGKNLRFIIGLQLVITFLSLVFGFTFLPSAGLSVSSLRIFGMIVIGDASFVIMYITLSILLYFDDRKGALLATLVFAVANGFFTGLIAPLGEGYYGLGFMGAAFLGLLVVLIRLKFFITYIDYFTFCSQPVSQYQQEKVFTRISNWLHKLS